jgi:hypothetical protein
VKLAGQVCKRRTFFTHAERSLLIRSKISRTDKSGAKGPVRTNLWRVFLQ